ncbi:hypothetical protein JSO61_007340 [Riemerella anatipestifer]|uniref:hypothetical protein n=1 Tax=Riemerella anatipestifer TaxID=34085 RepID=UPI0012AD7A65|nr:hypothetical protein [Riemerella anatipestifer]MDY3363743.1 hypothetical protein [Riemerella anatipestifer]MDY3520400.1 hypothetical protein [Riemerella anatipestifer]MDY3533375.1 hypothetical protein [Riemerella anatipestifer]MDY3534360.1 hypothetical protein [Riemerella anatipestifer]USL94882.1 hypothetical protein D1J36_006150 [Riemerella anatipestifer]
MENKKSEFQVLVSNMEVLSETEKGKLKGGITALSTVSESEWGLNVFCPKNYKCTSQPEVPKKEELIN